MSDEHRGETEMQREARRLHGMKQAGDRIDTAKVIPRPGEEAPDGWQGTPPAEGTRRALIRDAIAASVTEHFAPGAGTIESRDSFSLKIADAVEAALLQSAIDNEAMTRGAEALTDGLEEVDPTEPPAETTRRRVIFEVLRKKYNNKSEWPLTPEKCVDWIEAALLEADEITDIDRLNAIAEERWQRIGELEVDVEAKQATIDALAATVSMQADRLEQVNDVRKGGNRLDAIELAIERLAGGDRKKWPVTPTKIALVVEAEVRAIEKLANEGIAEVMTDAPDREAELLEQREEARTREGRFAEERDCAYALLRRLLPVTVAKRLD